MSDLSRKRILFYSEAFCPLSETFVYRIALGLHPYAVTVLTHERNNPREFPGAGLNITVRALGKPGVFVRAALVAWNGWRWRIPSAQVLSLDSVIGTNRVFRPDLLFAQFATCGFRTVPVARQLHIPHVTMFHGCDLGSWLHFPRYRRCLDTLFNEGTAFIVATEFMRKRAIALGCPSEKLHRIPYPVPTAHNLDSTVGTKKESERFRFLHVGRLHEQKGILFSIQAFSSVHSQDAKTEFVIVGDGPQRAQAEQLVHELKLADCVVFKGALPFPDVCRELSLADVYVIHSVATSLGDTEGFGVSLAEASEAGLPVVATNHNGFPDVVLNGKTGFLVPEKDVTAMADAMLRLVLDPVLCRDLGRAGRAYVRSNFAPDGITEAFRSLFDRLL